MTDPTAERLEGFWRRERPEVLAGLVMLENASHMREGGVGELVRALSWLHYHAIVGFEEGVATESRRAVDLGATREQLLELLALAFIHSGPKGMRAVASACEDLIGGLVARPGAAAAFPPGWEPDPGALRSGLDFSRPELSGDELAALRRWYLRYLGELPPYVEFLARYRPQLLKVYRNRLENAVRGALPKQIVPFALLHFECIRGYASGVREAALLARGFGVSRPQALEAVAAAFLYAGGAAVNVLERAAGDVVGAWPA